MKTSNTTNSYEQPKMTLQKDIYSPVNNKLIWGRAWDKIKILEEKEGLLLIKCGKEIFHVKKEFVK